MIAKDLNYSIPPYSNISLYGDELNNRNDFFISSNCNACDAEILIFFDSRGISKSYQGSLADLIINKISPYNNYLVISRPLEITTWMTLFNFCKLNGIHPSKIITNMGFVDFTPKKMSIINKSLAQYNCFFSDDMAILEYEENYISNDGTIMELFIQKYPQVFKEHLSNYFGRSEFIILNTPLLEDGFAFTRPRPKSFIKGITLGNEFNESLKLNSRIFNYYDFSAAETYDGVHFTNKGNSLIFESIVSNL